jgi:hypothetical protein
METMRDHPPKQESAPDASHTHALHIFGRRLVRLLSLRNAVQWMTLWFFIWGVIVLAVRISGMRQTEWLGLGLFGIVPLFILAIFRARQQKPEFTKIRASYDRVNSCGGVMMAEETADMSAWLPHLPNASAPRLHWRSGRMMTWLCLSALFVTTALLLPARLTNFAGHRQLEIGQIVEQLQAEVQTLAQEKILEVKPANELQQQLAAMKKDSSGLDPNKTWEALDHIKEGNSDLAKQAAEEAVNKTAELTQAQTLAAAMQEAAESGMNPETAMQAAQTLAGMIKGAKLEEGLINGQIPPDLLSDLNGLNKEQMDKLMKALELNKAALGATMSNLANLKMIDPATLAKCNNAGQNPDYAGLAMYLSQCQGGKCDSELLFSWLRKRGRGGPGGGGPEAPMDWDNDTSEDNLKFQAHMLPPSSHLSDARMIGLSKAAPDLSGNDIILQSGALDNAVASGGSAHSQVILPEHKQAVQRFFKRDQ